MARQYSIKALAELIADDTDTASAAEIFGKTAAYIQKVQRTEDYRRALELAKRRKSTQARKEITAIAGDGSANFFREIEAIVDQEVTIYFTYKVSGIPGDTFLLEWYDSIEDLQGNLNRLGEDDQPDDIRFNPETPIQISGTYIGIFHFTPIATGTRFAKIYVDNPRFEFIVLQINVRAARDIQASDFVFTSVDDFTVIEGQNAVVDTVYWEQGHPLIENFSLESITIWFFRDASSSDRILMLDSDFVVSDEPLDEIVTLENFVDNGNGTGSFDARVNPSEIDVMDFMRDRDVFFEYIVNQPDI